MTLKPNLLNALRKATNLVININPTTLELVPANVIRKPGGVLDFGPPLPPRPPQKFFIEPVVSTLAGITGAAGGAVATDGASGHSWSYNITGKHDCQMEIGDTWKNGETTYRIIGINPENGYEKVGVVAALGKDPAYG